jgi:hypothetical protein
MEYELVQDSPSLELMNNELKNYMTGSTIIKKLRRKNYYVDFLFLLRMKKIIQSVMIN